MFCPERKGCFSSVMDSSIHFQYAKRKGRGCCTNKYKVVAYQDVLQLTPSLYCVNQILHGWSDTTLSSDNTVKTSDLDMLVAA